MRIDTVRAALRGGLLVGAAAALTGCGYSNWDQARFGETRTLSADWSAGMGLSVATSNGAVEIERWDGDGVEIVANLRMRSQERLDDTLIVAERRDDGVMAIGVEWPDGRRMSNEGCSFEIRSPLLAGIDVDTGNGRVRLTGMGGHAEIQTSNGRVYLTDHDGSATINTSNGRVEARQVRGDLSIDTGNGRVIVEDVHGEVFVDTSNGAVAVELAADNPGPVDIRTSNGGVRLAVGDAFHGEVSMRTSNGGFEIDNLEDAKFSSLSKRSVRFVIGSEDQSSRVVTSNGTVTLERRGG